MRKDFGRNWWAFARAGRLCAALSLAAAHGARAQDFPTRPVRIVVAFPPGGPTDFVGRLVADKMTALLGQRVYIDNKPGANGTRRRRQRRQVRPRRLFAVPHHGRRGDGVAAHHGENAVRYVPRFRAGRAGHQGHRGAGGVAEARHQDRSRIWSRSPRKSPAPSPFASTGIGSPPHLAQVAARCRRRREIPARALSRRGAGADRSARRPGAGGRRSTSGADRANPGRQSGADRRRGRQARRHVCPTCRRSPSRAIPIPTPRTGTRCWRRPRRRPR